MSDRLDGLKLLLLDKFYRIVGEVKHKLLVTINYTLNQKERVYQIFEHGERSLDNNHDEQLIRPTTIGRKITYCEKQSWS